LTPVNGRYMVSLAAFALILVLIFSFAPDSIFGLLLVFADSTNTNMSYYIAASRKSLAAENIPAAIANLTQAIELVHVEQKEFYDFVAVGDFGCTSNTDKTVDNILDRGPNLVIALGDYSYDKTPDCWSKKIAPFHDKTKIAIGNHDKPAADYLKLFGMDESKQYYSFNHGTVHFLVMSTEIPFDAGSAQYKMVVSDLKNASEDPKLKWIIVVNHIMTYPRNFIHPDAMIGDSIRENAISKNFRDIYQPLFDRYNVDLVLQGHAHNYQRTYPLEYNTINPDIPIITDLHKTSYLNPEGILFVTVGTGGSISMVFRLQRMKLLTMLILKVFLLQRTLTVFSILKYRKMDLYWKDFFTIIMMLVPIHHTYKIHLVSRR
jgi:predicted phosphodiesterase